MHWIAPSERDAATDTLERWLWAAAEQAGPAPYIGLKSQGYSGGRLQGPVLGLTFPDYVAVRFASKRAQLQSPSPLEAGRGSAERDGVRGEGYSGDPSKEFSIHGVEKTDETRRLSSVNRAVEALDCDIRQDGNVDSHCDDPNDATGQST